MEMESGGMMRWLLTYADMLTLLFALFIILYAMASTDQVKYEALSQAFRQTFGALPGTSHMLESTGGEVPGFAIVPGVGDSTGGGGIPKKLRKHLASIEGVTISENERAITVTIKADGLLFVKGQSDLLEGVKKILDPLSIELRQNKMAVVVEGHTCDLPINSSRYPSNWELSTARAAIIVRYLMGKGVDPGTMAASGYGSSRPLAPNTSESNRKLNRRVDIIILKERPPGTPIKAKS